MDDNNDKEFSLCAIQMKMITDTLVELAKKNETLERNLETRQMELIKLNSQLYDLTEENRKLKEEQEK